MHSTVSKISTFVMPILAFALLAGAPGDVTAQLDHLPFQLKYDRGQTVQPIFDGWSRNDDGSVDMHFGYLNRNYVEEVHAPLGADNRFEPGDPDRGQPTFFHTRSNRMIFTVTVPADFGDQELVWSLTTQGEPLRAIGSLDPLWEIVDGSTGLSTGAGTEEDEEDPDPNLPPELSFTGAPLSATLPASFTIVAGVADDGKPEPEPEEPEDDDPDDDQDQADDQDPPAFVGTQGRPPLLNPPADALEIPVNIPQHEAQRRSRPRDVVTVVYDVWRGPANITAEPYYAVVENGTATTTMTFTEPGEYQLRATADDGDLSTDQFVTVVVRE